MTKIIDVLPCGKRGGSSFIETVRVDPYSWKCPDGLEPCSYFTNPTDTICVKFEDKATQCPILDIFVANETQAEKLDKNAYEVTKEGLLQPDGSYIYLAFSKQYNTAVFTNS